MICLLFCDFNMNAQNYYSTTKIISGNGYSYKCDVVKSFLITLYNSKDNSRLVYDSPVVKSTGKVFTDYDFTDLTELKQDNIMDPKIESIVNSAFSPSQKQLVKEEELSVNMCINTTTGKVDVVYFEFIMSSHYISIPLSVFRQIEVEIKKNIWFSITEDGKKLDFISSNRFIEPK